MLGIDEANTRIGGIGHIIVSILAFFFKTAKKIIEGLNGNREEMGGT